jgi:hypothetical protein
MRRRAAIIALSMLTYLIGGVGLWLRAQERQYALNRQLIAALVKGDNQKALTLVKAGTNRIRATHPRRYFHCSSG